MTVKAVQSMHDEIMRRALDVEAYGSAVAREDLMPALDSALREIEKAIATGTGTAFTKARFSKMRGQLSGVLSSLGKKYTGVLDQARLEVIGTEFEHITEVMAKDTRDRLEGIKYSIPVDQAKAMLKEPVGGQYLGDWIDSHLGGMSGRIRRELTTSLIQGETVQQASARLRGAFDMSRNGADLIARTAVMQAANAARDAVYDQFDDVIEAYQVLATLDMRTCFACAKWDGAVSKDRKALPDFPIHIRCRCLKLPITDLDALDETTRAAVFEQDPHTVHHTAKDPDTGKRVPDGTTSTTWKVQKAGQVSADTTFKDFFKRQPEAWKKSYLGTSRYDLYQQGKLKFEDLAQNTEVRTLEQIRAARK